MSLLWKDPKDKTCAILTKETNEIITLKVGDFITFKGRTEGSEGVRIEEFTWKSSDDRGPIGMIYLPWRAAEKRWATVAWSMKGNLRHIIAFPVGMSHFGQQIDWETVIFMNGGVCPIADAVAVAELVRAPPAQPLNT
jgi:hypothetical protein